MAVLPGVFEQVQVRQGRADRKGAGAVGSAVRTIQIVKSTEGTEGTYGLERYPQCHCHPVDTGAYRLAVACDPKLEPAAGLSRVDPARVGGDLAPPYSGNA